MFTQNPREEQALAMMRIRDEHPPDRKINRKWKWRRLTVGFDWGARSNFWGRFGGGWQWKLGFSSSSWRSVRVHLLICDVHWHLARRDDGAKTSGRATV